MVQLIIMVHQVEFLCPFSGVEPTGLKAGQKALFTVDARGAGDGELDVFVEGPQGEEKVDVKNNGDATYSCMYFPAKYGNYVVNVTWSSVQVPNSPFHVKVATAVDASKIKAYGPGLEKGELIIAFITCILATLYLFLRTFIMHNQIIPEINFNRFSTTGQCAASEPSQQKTSHLLNPFGSFSHSCPLYLADFLHSTT